VVQKSTMVTAEMVALSEPMTVKSPRMPTHEYVPFTSGTQRAYARSGYPRSLHFAHFAQRVTRLERPSYYGGAGTRSAGPPTAVAPMASSSRSGHHQAADAVLGDSAPRTALDTWFRPSGGQYVADAGSQAPTHRAWRSRAARRLSYTPSARLNAEAHVCCAVPRLAPIRYGACHVDTGSEPVTLG
jgi:hypothetical protein